MLKEKNEYVVKKNLSLDKEVRRINLALKEALRAKSEMNKDLISQREMLEEAIKANTVLND